MNPKNCLLSAERKIQRELKWKLLFGSAKKINQGNGNSREVRVEDIDELVLNRSSIPKNKSISKRNISFSTGTRIKKLHRSNIKRKKDIKRLCLKKCILEDLENSIIEHDVYLEHTIQNNGNISSMKSPTQVTRYIKGFPYRMNINYTYPQCHCDTKLGNGYQNSDKILKRGYDEERQEKKRQRKTISELIANLTQNLNNSKANCTNSGDYLDICTNKIDNLGIDVSDVEIIGPRSMGNNLYSHDVYHLSLNKMYRPETRNLKKHSVDTTHIAALSETTKDMNLYDSGVTVDIGTQTCELNSVNKNQMKVIRSPSPIMIQNVGSRKDVIRVNSTTLDQNKTFKTMMSADGSSVSSNWKGVSSDPNKTINEGIIPVNYKKNPFLDTDKFPTILGSAENKAAKTSDSNETPITPATKSKKRKAIRNFSKEITSSNDSSPNEIIGKLRSAKNVIEEDEADAILNYNDGTINSNKITLTPEARSKNKTRNVKTEVVTILDCRNGSLDSNKTPRTPRAKAKTGVKAVQINRKDRISSSCEENLLFDSNKTRTGLKSGNAAMKGAKVTITSDCKDESLDSNLDPITAVTKYKSKKIIKGSKEMLSTNCRKNHLVDSNQIPACIKGTKTVTKEDHATTASDYKDELLDQNSARIKPTKKSKNTKGVRNSSKEIISLNCEENQFLDPNEIHAASDGANKRQVKDKVTTNSDDKDEFLDPNSSPKKPTKKSKNTKIVKNSTEFLSLNCKEKQFLDSNEIRAASGDANIVIKVDKGTTTSDYNDERFNSNPAPIARAKKYNNTKAVRNSSKENLSLNCKEKQFLDSNEIRAASGDANIVIKVDKGTTTSDYNDERFDSNPAPIARAKKYNNTKAVRNSSKENLSLNCKEKQFLDSNEIRAASGDANIVIKVDKGTTTSDYNDERFDSNPAPIARAKKYNNTKAVRNSSKENLSLNCKEKQFLDSNEIRAASGDANIVIKVDKGTTTSDYNDERFDSNPAPITRATKYNNTKAVRNSSKGNLPLNCKEKQFLDSNEIRAASGEANIVIKVDKVTTTSDYNYEGFDSNPAPITRATKHNNTKAVRNSSKENLSLNCKEKQFLNSNEIRAASGDANIVIKVDKVTITSDYNYEGFDSNPAPITRAIKYNNSKAVRNSSKENLSLNCKEKQFLDSNEIRAASGDANIVIKVDKGTTTSDYNDEGFNSNPAPITRATKYNNTKAVRNSSKENLSLNCKEKQFLDSNEIHAASGGTNKRQIKNKVTTDSDDKDELLDSNSYHKKPTKKTKNTKIVKYSRKEILSLNCKENQFLDSNENRATSDEANVVIKVNKATTTLDYKDEVLDSNLAPIKPAKNSKNAKTVKNSSKEIISSNRKENNFLDPNKNLVTLTSAKAVMKVEKTAVTSDYIDNKNVVTPRAKSKTRNAGQANTEEDSSYNHFLHSDEIPASLTRAKPAVKVDEVATTSNDKNGNLDFNKSAGKRSVKSKNVKAGRASRKDVISSNVEENNLLVSNKSTATATSVKTVTKEDQTSATSYSDTALDSNKTRIASTTKLKSMEVTKSNGSLNLNSNAMKLSNVKISSSSNNNSTSNLQGTVQRIRSRSDSPTYSSRIVNNKTKDLIESFARDVSFKEVNFASDTGNTEHQLCLSRNDEEYISRYLKETNDPCEYEDLRRIVNVVQQRSPQITNYILAMRVLEVLGRSRSDRYDFLGNGVKDGISTISKFLGRRCFETYLAYALWLYERKRKT